MVLLEATAFLGLLLGHDFSHRLRVDRPGHWVASMRRCFLHLLGQFLEGLSGVKVLHRGSFDLTQCVRLLELDVLVALWLV